MYRLQLINMRNFGENRQSMAELRRVLGCKNFGIPIEMGKGVKELKPSDVFFVYFLTPSEFLTPTLFLTLTKFNLEFNSELERENRVRLAQVYSQKEAENHFMLVEVRGQKEVVLEKGVASKLMINMEEEFTLIRGMGEKIGTFGYYCPLLPTAWANEATQVFMSSTHR